LQICDKLIKDPSFDRTWDIGASPLQISLYPDPELTDWHLVLDFIRVLNEGIVECRIGDRVIFEAVELVLVLLGSIQRKFAAKIHLDEIENVQTTDLTELEILYQMNISPEEKEHVKQQRRLLNDLAEALLDTSNALSHQVRLMSSLFCYAIRKSEAGRRFLIKSHRFRVKANQYRTAICLRPLPVHADFEVIVAKYREDTLNFMKDMMKEAVDFFDRYPDGSLEHHHRMQKLLNSMSETSVLLEKVQELT